MFVIFAWAPIMYLFLFVRVSSLLAVYALPICFAQWSAGNYCSLLLENLTSSSTMRAITNPWGPWAFAFHLRSSACWLGLGFIWYALEVLSFGIVRLCSFSCLLELLHILWNGSRATSWPWGRVSDRGDVIGGTGVWGRFGCWWLVSHAGQYVWNRPSVLACPVLLHCYLAFWKSLRLKLVLFYNKVLWRTVKNYVKSHTGCVIWQLPWVNGHSAALALC